MMMSTILTAQDPQFSQPYANSMYLNPALTGDTPENRLSLDYRNQWSAIENGFSSYIASFDRFEQRINSGIGAYFLHDGSGANGYVVNGLSVNYAYDVQLARESGLRAGLDLGYFFISYDKKKLLFPDQFIRGGANTSIENLTNDRSSYLDIGAGVLYYNKNLWAGISVGHVNTPNISLIDQQELLPRKISMHAGIKLWRRTNSFDKELGSLSLITHYKVQGDFDQLDLGVYYDFKPLVVGVWYRGLSLINSVNDTPIQPESIILLLGVEFKEFFRVAYSYDITISQIGFNSGGSHEISIIYEWVSNKKNNPLRRVSCPKF
jgi:type IX secretion system PorP/SprF family membrane protein